VARGGGWFARARELLEAGGYDCVERGYLLIPEALQRLAVGDIAGARASSSEAAEIGGRFQDQDLITFGRLGVGQAMIREGSPTAAAALLDEVMIAVTGGQVSPIVVGIVSCAVIEASMEMFDLRRAQEYTASLARWCAAQPDLVPFRGQCLVHQAQIMTLHGAWPDAIDAAQDACARLADAGQPAAGGAFYQRGELHRLRGEFAEAEQAFQRARRWIRDPQPGPALLLLAQGHLDAATAAIRRAMDDTADRVDRSTLLGAAVEIALAGGDVPSARAAADELRAIADQFGGAWLDAVAAQAVGAVLIAEQDPQAAMDALRRAWSAWQTLDTPYEAARVRVLMGTACRVLGDDHSAEMELDAARWIFAELGALPDVARVDALSRSADAQSPGGLTAREIQVLRLVATGRTNRAVAADLFLSEKTIARHVSNIFTKLGVTSRSAATAYAYEHGLVPGD
jgi:DNA-binding CsgD family transcriptional regulator/tetratricopeptide (TPR) repeat protein